MLVNGRIRDAELVSDRLDRLALSDTVEDISLTPGKAPEALEGCGALGS